MKTIITTILLSLSLAAQKIPNILPLVIDKIPLGDADTFARLGGQPDTVVTFSPDNRYLAIGTVTGKLLLAQAETGKIIRQSKLAEGMIKSISFSPSGDKLYYGEQSVDGNITCTDTKTGKTIWKLPLSNDLGKGTPPSPDNPYGIYYLPGCYQLKTLTDGDLLVLGIHTHGDYTKTGKIIRISKLYRLAPDGTIRWEFPKGAPAPQSMLYAESDPKGTLFTALLGHKSGTAEKPLYPSGTLITLDGSSGTPLGTHTFPPLSPHFQKTGFWRAVSVSPDAKTISVGLQDGRCFLFNTNPLTVRRMYNFGTPILISDIPVSARASYSHITVDGSICFQTGVSSVPVANSMDYISTPPGPHPNANTITILAPEGTIKWRYRSGHTCFGFYSSRDGKKVMCPVQKQEKNNSDSGFILFDTSRKGGGSNKRIYEYRIQGVPFFQADISPDGSRCALVEVPFKHPESGHIIGTWQVHLVTTKSIL